MKKIALVLALALVLGCVFVMAGCTATPAESSVEETSAEETSVEETSAEETSAEETSAEETSAEETSAEETSEEESTADDGELKVGDANVFWVVYVNADSEAEGTGAVCNYADFGGSWSHHVAFSPIEGIENGYEITAICSGEDGQGYALTCPEGGFIWTHNVGNDWPTLTAGLTGDGSSGLWYDTESYLNAPNYASPASQAAWDLAETWSVGDRFIITGIDFDTNEAPTSTPDLAYTDADYVCTATIAAILN